jgi:hypothetical protein
MTTCTDTKPECCPSCRRYTMRGQQQRAEQYRQRTLSGIDLSQPLSGLVEGLRSDIAKVRSKLQDIGWGYTGWGEHLECSIGGLTCVLVALHETMERMREAETRRDGERVEDSK